MGADGVARRLVHLALAVTLVVHAVLAAFVRRDARGRDVDGTRRVVATPATGLVGVAGYVRARIRAGRR